jgi:hypothetical protein
MKPFLAVIVFWLATFSGCAALSGPTAAQQSACAALLTAQIKSGVLTDKTLAQSYDAQLHASPPTLPAPCAGIAP